MAERQGNQDATRAVGTTVTVHAPAKLNLALHLGASRADGLHEIRSLFVPLLLADRLTVTYNAEGDDQVVCPGIDGPNLATAALAKLREAGWNAPPVTIEIEKRIPVAAGLGGGSADAGAVLSLAIGDLDPDRLHQIAITLGADVPSQITPRALLVGGAGETFVPLPAPAPLGVVLLASDRGLTAAEVYAEADRLGLGSPAGSLEPVTAAGRMRDTYGYGNDPSRIAATVGNDLGIAARSLRPELADAMAILTDAGALAAEVTGSGPTVFGLFPDLDAARRAADRITEEATADDPFDRVIATGLAPGRPATDIAADNGTAPGDTR